MTAPVVIGNATLYQGNCLSVLTGFEPDSVDAIVTDPPYGIRFMGKEWDGKDIEATVRRKARKATCRPDGWKRQDGAAFAAGTYNLSPSANRTFQEWVQEWASQCLRVLKPGGHLLAFGSPRVYHRLASGIEDSGFEIRDQIMWLYGSGWPKSHNLEGDCDGWGTALKPAHEPIVVARKPLIGTVAENVERYGTGALNIDGCRVEGRERTEYGLANSSRSPGNTYSEPSASADFNSTKGRWPANVIHDGSDEVMAEFAKYGESSTKRIEKPSECVEDANTWGGTFQRNRGARGHTDSGTAARFFYCAKANRKDRNEGCEALESQPLNWSSGDQNPGSFQSQGTDRTARNHHPTVKPTELMRYLCRLVTPPAGVILDCFMGSGSTGKAALLEGFRFIGIEREPEYFEIAKARVAAASGQPVVEPASTEKQEEPQPDLFSFTAA